MGLCPVPSAPHQHLLPTELPQVEVTKAYFAKQADEITLQQADVVLVMEEEDGECTWVTAWGALGEQPHRDPGCGLPLTALGLHSGWLHGERLRDGEMGWFPEDFARRITSPVAVEGNVRRMERLRVETDV